MSHRLSQKLAQKFKRKELWQINSKKAEKGKSRIKNIFSEDNKIRFIHMAIKNKSSK